MSFSASASEARAEKRAAERAYVSAVVSPQAIYGREVPVSDDVNGRVLDGAIDLLCEDAVGTLLVVDCKD